VKEVKGAIVEVEKIGKMRNNGETDRVEQPKDLVRMRCVTQNGGSDGDVAELRDDVNLELPLC
jgi:hypothetical protein